MEKIVNRAFKFRIYPNSEQQTKIKQFAGASRFIYNHFLSQKIENYQKNKKSSSFFDDCLSLTQLKKSKVWLNEIPSQVLQTSLKDLNQAHLNLYQGRANKPKYYQEEILFN